MSIKLAVIIRGNKKYLDNIHLKKRSESFYSTILSIFKTYGFLVEFDDGLPFTCPNQKAHIWVAHSRGIDRLQFANENIHTIALETNDYLVSSNDNDSIGYSPKHYQLSNCDCLRIYQYILRSQMNLSYCNKISD